MIRIEVYGMPGASGDDLTCTASRDGGEQLFVVVAPRAVALDALAQFVLNLKQKAVGSR